MGKPSKVTTHASSKISKSGNTELDPRESVAKRKLEFG